MWSNYPGLGFLGPRPRGGTDPQHAHTCSSEGQFAVLCGRASRLLVWSHRAQARTQHSTSRVNLTEAETRILFSDSLISHSFH